MTELDPRVVLDALGYPGVDGVAPVSGGRDTMVYCVEHRGSRYALRIFSPGRFRDSQSEILAMETAAAGGVPVPGVQASGSHAGHPVVLLDWCQGATVGEWLTRHPERANALGATCGRMLARIHAVTVPASEQGGWLDWGGLQPDDPLYQRLTQIARPDRLLHLDFHPLNILTDGERVTAVLDWVNARVGDPRADIARSVAILRLDTGDLPAEARPILRAYERGLRDGYTAQAGPLLNMPLFHIWAGRAMLHDIALRPTTNPIQVARIRRWIRLWAGLASDASPARLFVTRT